MPKNVIGEFSVSRLDILDVDGNVDEELDPGLDRAARARVEAISDPSGARRARARPRLTSP